MARTQNKTAFRWKAVYLFKCYLRFYSFHNHIFQQNFKSHRVTTSFVRQEKFTITTKHTIIICYMMFPIIPMKFHIKLIETESLSILGISFGFLQLAYHSVVHSKSPFGYEIKKRHAVISRVYSTKLNIIHHHSHIGSIVLFKLRVNNKTRFVMTLITLLNLYLFIRFISLTFHALFDYAHRVYITSWYYPFSFCPTDNATQVVNPHKIVPQAISTTVTNKVQSRNVAKFVKS